MNWKDIGKTVAGKGLPILGGLLGGKLGEKAGNLVAGVLGCEADAEAVSNALENNPELFLQLQKYEMDHKEALQALEIQEVGLYLADVQSARSREVEITKATGKRDWFLYALAGLVIACYFILIGVYFFFQPAETTMLVMLISNLANNATLVLAYFFGSSKGSGDKNVMLNDKVKNGH